MRIRIRFKSRRSSSRTRVKAVGISAPSYRGGRPAPIARGRLGAPREDRVAQDTSLAFDGPDHAVLREREHDDRSKAQRGVADARHARQLCAKLHLQRGRLPAYAIVGFRLDHPRSRRPMAVRQLRDQPPRLDDATRPHGPFRRLRDRPAHPRTAVRDRCRGVVAIPAPYAAADRDARAPGHGATTPYGPSFARPVRGRHARR